MENMDDFELAKLTDESVDIMCKVNAKYKKFVFYEKGEKFLYLQLTKALYGCNQSALSWYQNFKTKLVNMGFVLNKYDLCVANKSVNSKQCIVCWYVDDANISHVDESVIGDVITQLEDVFGKMVVIRGHKHTFVGMDFELINDGTLSISMP